MKKFLYLLLPFLLLGHASQAQETRPSPWFPDGAENGITASMTSIWGWAWQRAAST